MSAAPPATIAVDDRPPPDGGAGGGFGFGDGTAGKMVSVRAEAPATISDCCPPLAEEAVSLRDARRLAGWFAVLADPTRLRLLSLMAARGEVCGSCDLVEELGVSQPTVSHHLRILREAGLVESYKKGRYVYCHPVPERLGALSRALGS